MQRFIEVQNWGFNALIFSSFITMLFTVFQGYGFLKQSQKIWKKESAESLSAPFFFLFFFYFIAFIFYGLSKNSLAMTFNGLLFLPCFPIVIGVIKFKKLNWIDVVSLILTAAIIPIMIMVKEKDLFLFLLLMISIITLITQSIAMIKTKSRGSVEIKFIIIFFLTSAFWLIYSSVIGNWVLQVFNSIACIIYCLIIYLYRTYKV